MSGSSTATRGRVKPVHRPGSLAAMKRVMRGAGVYVVLALIALLVLTTLFHGGLVPQEAHA